MSNANHHHVFRFPKGVRNALIEIFQRTAKNPGPGYYEVLKTSEGESNKKGVSIKGKPKDLNGEKTPGPGHYITPSGLSKRSHSVGKGLRPPLNLQDPSIPGPGTYHAGQGKDTQGWKFGRSKRTDTLANADVPGPGAYGKILEEENEKLTEQQLEILKPRNKHEFGVVGQRSLSPGPGYYCSDYKLVWPRSPAFGYLIFQS